MLALTHQAATATAFQPDAAFLAYQEKNKAKWAQEDEIIDEKLAALEQKLSKKPNIIYILAYEAEDRRIGEPPGDFVIQGPEATGHKGYIALHGMDWPGLTASLAIGEYVADLALGGLR